MHKVHLTSSRRTTHGTLKHLRVGFEQTCRSHRIIFGVVDIPLTVGSPFRLVATRTNLEQPFILCGLIPIRTWITRTLNSHERTQNVWVNPVGLPSLDDCLFDFGREPLELLEIGPSLPDAQISRRTLFGREAFGTYLSSRQLRDISLSFWVRDIVQRLSCLGSMFKPSLQALDTSQTQLIQ